MFSSSRRNLRKAKQLVADGNLEHAALFCNEHKLAENHFGRSVIGKLVRQLIDLASQRQSRGDMQSAWRALACADIVCLENDRDMLSREMNRFVELTIEHADHMLVTGKPTHATSTVNLLSERRILDRRADQIKRVAKVLNNADQLAAQGRLKEARQELQIAAAQRPDLEYIKRRLESYDQQKSHLEDLQTELRRAITRSAWSDARNVSSEMLEIAPNCQLAMDARKRCDQRLPGGHSITTIFRKKAGEDGQTEPARNPMNDEHDSIIHQKCESFLLWIDGVGGYLVCSGDAVMIGQAVPESGVDIPMLGDVRRRHAIIRRFGECDMIESLGDVVLENQQVSEPQMLKNNQLIDLGHGVQLTYRRPHSLSSTARLEFTSRHRTQPWSDAVLLATDTIVLGRGSQSHVQCPHFQRDIVLFKEKGQWHCRIEGDFVVDGQPASKRSPISTNSRIHSDDFSICLETIE